MSPYGDVRAHQIRTPQVACMALHGESWSTAGVFVGVCVRDSECEPRNELCKGLSLRPMNRRCFWTSLPLVNTIRQFTITIVTAGMVGS